MKPQRKQFGFKTVFSILFWYVGLTLSGQVKDDFSISGIVVDSTSKQPVEFASVAIYRIPDASLVTGVITNSRGEFTIIGLNPGNFIIKSSFVGYKTETTPIEISNSSVRLTKPILMNSSTLLLNEVQVTGKLNEKQISIEKTKINVSQNISAISGNVAEVLKSQPSINILGDERK